MGFDKLLNFLNYNLNSEIMEEINIKTGIRKILANNIMFDISFIIYNSLIKIEEEINTIIKIILSLPFSIYSSGINESKINEIYLQKHWFNNIKNLYEILDHNDEDVIIVNFINYIKSDNILDNIICDKVFINIINFINNIHYIEYINTINIIFDGIPSYSKILEQRRRRIRNYIESKHRKKKLTEYFKSIENCFYDNNGIKYNYYKWLKYRFSIDKSFGPVSSFTKLIENNIYLKLLEYYSNIIININSSINNGEADYKIFNEIYKNNYIGDIVIHTIDSDLVHQIIIQQNYFNLIKKDITLSVIKYNNKNNDYIYYIDGQTINKNLLNIYDNITNNTLFNSERQYIIYDIALIFYFFGNDHLPSSFDIGPELTLELYFKTHYSSLKNNYVIELDKNNKITLNYNNLLLWLKKINNTNEINKTKIILTRYFKLNYQIMHYLTEKLELNFNDIIKLCKKILFDDGKKHNELEKDDLRYILINKYENIDFPLDITQLDKNEFNLNMNKLLNCLDITDTEDKFCGLPLYNKYFYFVDDKYENIYINFNENIINDLMKKYTYIYDYTTINNILFSQNLININQINEEIYSYLKKIHHLVTTLFSDMTFYNSNNLTYFNGYKVPSIFLILNFLEKNTNLNNKFNDEIITDTIDNNNYFNSINHYLIISPYIKDILYKFKNKDIEYFIKNINIDGLWIDFETNYKYKEINIYQFINSWKNSLIKLLLNVKLTPEILMESEQYLIKFN